jgi:hypothetical protein
LAYLTFPNSSGNPLSQYPHLYSACWGYCYYPAISSIPLLWPQLITWKCSMCLVTSILLLRVVDLLTLPLDPLLSSSHHTQTKFVCAWLVKHANLALINSYLTSGGDCGLCICVSVDVEQNVHVCVHHFPSRGTVPIGHGLFNTCFFLFIKPLQAVQVDAITYIVKSFLSDFCCVWKPSRNEYAVSFISHWNS